MQGICYFPIVKYKVMNISFQDKTVVVTGAAKGIGAAVAQLFHESGATVIMMDISTDGEKVRTALGRKAHFYGCDVSSSGQVKEVFKRIGERFERIDVLINNAGIQTYGKVVDTDEELWDRTINVNLKSAFLCAKHAIPLMKESFSPAIINIASVQALVCQENAAAYITSKAGMLGLTKAIAVDYAPHIRCVAVCPGAVNTEMFQYDLKTSDDPAKFIEDARNTHLLKKIADPADVASMALFLASERAPFCTGEYYRMDAGIGAKIVTQ